VNDGTLVNIWQDGAVTGNPDARVIADVETLRAIAEPTRYAIYSALLKPPWPRVMSVKELAAELDMTPTRLYRHVRQLEEVNLIKVAETRMVSGILEQRYQATDRDVEVSRDFLHSHPDESLAALIVLMEEFARGTIAAMDDADHQPVLFSSDNRISAEAARELARRLKELTDWLHGVPQDPDGVRANVLFGFYVD
jgi:DNA-binding transcriptional ArsR family regulator